MKLVIIGGTGLIGSKLVATLRDLGHDAVPGKRVANAYVKSVDGLLTGQVIDVL